MEMMKKILKNVTYLFGVLIALIVIVIILTNLSLNGQKSISPLDMAQIARFMLPIPLISMGLLFLIGLFKKKKKVKGTPQYI
jgi:energy-converting hydrogenase Eha subunit A